MGFVPFAGGSRGGVPIRRSLSQTDVEDKVTQDVVNRMLEDVMLVHNPLWELMPRKPGAGPSAIISQRTARGAARFVADTDAESVVESTFGARPDFPYKTLLYEGKVTRKSEAISRNYIDLVAGEIESGVQALRDAHEEAFFDGDIGSDADEFDGLNDTNIVPSGQRISMGTNGAALTLAKIDEAIDQCDAMPSFMAMAKRTRRALNSLLQAQQRFVNSVKTDAGFMLMTYNEIPIVWSQYVGIADTQGSASNASKIHFVDTSKTWMEDLTPLTRMPLARASSQYERFDIFMDTVLVVSNNRFNSQLVGIIPG